jgi:hypothetical protein
LKQNQRIVRTVADKYIENSRSNVLQQYFLLTFTYSLKNFGSGKAPAARKTIGFYLIFNSDQVNCSFFA